MTKMDQETVKSAVRDTIRDIKSGLDRGDFTSASEADVKSAIVGRLLKCLGWDRDDLRQIRMEYSTEDGGKVDFALLNPSRDPALFIEAKRMGNITHAGERQLLRYAFESGVPIAILTDGIEWNFDLPLLACPYAERRFYSLNLRDHDLEYCVAIFLDFLLRDNVLSGAAHAKANKIIAEKKAIKEVRNTLPKVWGEVFSEAKDSYLADALKKAVSSKCGHAPQETDIKEFLDRELERIKRAGMPSTPSPQGGEESHREKSGTVLLPSKNKGIKMLHAVLSKLALEDPDFLSRYEQATSQRVRNRKVVSKTKEDLYQGDNGRKLLLEQGYEKLPGGWYMGKNMSRAQIKERVGIALSVANVSIREFGDEEFRKWMSSP